MPAWLDELTAGGYLTYPFWWDADGRCTFAESISPAERAAIEAIFAAHPDEKPFTVGLPSPVLPSTPTPREASAPGDQG